jgi:hypothetical protein
MKRPGRPALLGYRLAEPRGAELGAAAVRLGAVPFAVLEVAIERGNYPPGEERWAWTLVLVLAGGAVVLGALARRSDPGRLGLVSLAFDVVLVTGWVVLYAFEIGTPVRGLLALPVVGAALRFGVRGVAAAPACAPALALFEWRGPHAFDPGHVILPVALLAFLALVVGLLVDALRGRPVG